MTVSIAAENTAEMLKEYGFADFLHEEVIKIDESRKVIILVFEKYFMRIEGRAGVTVLVDDTSGVTDVRVITSGVGQGFFLSFDWGASYSMINDIRDCLEQYITEERELE